MSPFLTTYQVIKAALNKINFDPWIEVHAALAYNHDFFHESRRDIYARSVFFDVRMYMYLPNERWADQDSCMKSVHISERQRTTSQSRREAKGIIALYLLLQCVRSCQYPARIYTKPSAIIFRRRMGFLEQGQGWIYISS